VPARALALDVTAGAHARIDRYEEAVHQALPDEPHWYLGVLATHPAHAGRRWGRAVMAAGLRQAREDGLAACLETTMPANVELYEREGWQLAATVAVEPLSVRVMRHPAGASRASESRPG
jgi:ribosomal protein S18 acetylase RimI-like enzyme